MVLPNLKDFHQSTPEISQLNKTEENPPNMKTALDQPLQRVTDPEHQSLKGVIQVGTTGRVLTEETSLTCSEDVCEEDLTLSVRRLVEDEMFSWFDAE